MIRKIIQIDEGKCNGCGLCAEACHEGAIAMVNGVAKLIRDDYCDGLGDCLPACPMDAITFVEREAAAYDEAAVKAHLARRMEGAGQGKTSGLDVGKGNVVGREIAGAAVGVGVGAEDRSDRQGQGSDCGCDAGGGKDAPKMDPGKMAELFSGCSGMKAMELNRSGTVEGTASAASDAGVKGEAGGLRPASCLAQWPVQIKLVPVKAPYFHQADVLVAADCTAFACGSFHQDYMKGRITLVGCPKLDRVDYSDKLAEILIQNEIKSLLVARMEVPCCSGLEHAVRRAAQIAEAETGKVIPVTVSVLPIRG